MRFGFSLVELSIVLVILGLLTGGILSGQSLIRAAELRSVTTEFQNWQTATQTFRERYFYLPGDMPNAVSFWAAPGGNLANCPSTAGTGKETCNGNGDGQIVRSPSANQYAERHMFWQQLANAGLIEGSYTGRSGSGGQDHHIAGSNTPRSKLSNGAWAVFNDNSQVTFSSGAVFYGDYTSQFSFGLLIINSLPNGGILLPEELWNIDTKIDDGKPAIGRVVTRNRVNCAVAADGTALTTSVADANKLDAVYNLQSSTKDCAIIFRQSY